MHLVITNADLRELVVQIAGATAWKSRAGSGTGSIFTLELGPAMPADEQQGEFSLMVYCAWRIVKESKIVCSWHNDSAEVLVPQLAALEQLVVSKAKLSEWNDLTIEFSTGQELHILNDLPPLQDVDSSWFITYMGEYHYCVNTDSTITRESVSG